MKIAFVNLDDSDQEYINQKIKSDQSDIQILFIKDLASEIDSIKDADVLSVFVDTQVDKKIIDSLPNLKLISTRSTGFDHLDIEYAKSKNIIISNVPTYGSNTVAEFTFGLILTVSRKLYESYDRIKTEGQTDVKDFEGFDLNGKTLGVIGTGHIGLNVIKIAKGFGMNVIATDLFPNTDKSQELGFEYTDLDNLLTQSDIVTLHVPYTGENKHLINAEKISLMKNTAYIINTARGEIIDTKALIEALESGKIAGAGLDVLEGEHQLKEDINLLLTETNDINEFQTLLANYRLVEMPQVVVTPHIAFNTKEAKGEIIETTLENILGFINQKPINEVKIK